MKCQKNLMRLLNANCLKLTNRTFSSGSADMPRIDCNIAVLPDFIALYSEPGLYRKTDRTAVAFYEYDSVFDGKNGLYQGVRIGLKSVGIHGIKGIIAIFASSTTIDYTEVWQEDSSHVQSSCW